MMVISWWILCVSFRYQLYATMVSFYLPLCVMVVVYMKILRVVTVKKKEMAWTNSSSRGNSIDQSTLTTNVNVRPSHQTQLHLEQMNHPLAGEKESCGTNLLSPPSKPKRTGREQIKLT